MKIRPARQVIEVELPSGEKSTIEVVVREYKTGGAVIAVGKEELRFDSEGRLEDLSDPDPHLCNWCGESYLIDDYPVGWGGASVSVGMSSMALGDGSVYGFSLCDWCLAHLFELFRHAPRVRSYIHGRNHPFIPERVLAERDGSPRYKEKFFAQKRVRDEAREKAPRRGVLNAMEVATLGLWKVGCSAFLDAPRDPQNPWYLHHEGPVREGARGRPPALVSWRPGDAFFEVFALVEGEEGRDIAAPPVVIAADAEALLGYLTDGPASDV